ncbi:amine oxidase, flavin-containing superfamily [Aspergillus undulatus]|uniref:amine oxidase, flavin-containing superfamily n=1 Tax=Aspergillus undulatus TaxID=1810928 RepID=UPI003CCE1AF6
MRCPQLTGLWVLTGWLGAAFAQNGSDGGEQVIIRDVAIIGGGATGTYAAIRLREMGKSVILVERENKLGGHTDTYYDPAAGPIDYGVWIYTNTTETRNFFAHLNIPVRAEHLAPDPAGSLRYDFRTGQPFPPPSGNTTDAMTRYIQILMQHPYLENGYDLPYPVPEELLLPFGDFVERYDLGAAVGVILGFAHGHGDVINDPAIYVLKDCNLNVVLGGLNGFIRPASGANQDTYTAAAEELGDDVLYKSTVVESHRPHPYNTDNSTSHPHDLLVRTPTGFREIQASKLLVTIPPLPKILSAFDLDHREAGIFGKFKSSSYYNSVLHITGLPYGTEVLNGANETPFNVPVLPGLYILGPAAPDHDLYVAFLGGLSEPIPKAQALQIIRDNVLSLQNAGYPVSEPEVRAYGDHWPYTLHVSASDIVGGFYARLNGLQGYRDTFWTGPAFHADNTGSLWRFTERLLQRYFVDD